MATSDADEQDLLFVDFWLQMHECIDALDNQVHKATGLSRRAVEDLLRFAGTAVRGPSVSRIDLEFLETDVMPDYRWLGAELGMAGSIECDLVSILLERRELELARQTLEAAMELFDDLCLRALELELAIELNDWEAALQTKDGCIEALRPLGVVDWQLPAGNAADPEFNALVQDTLQIALASSRLDALLGRVDRSLRTLERLARQADALPPVPAAIVRIQLLDRLLQTNRNDTVLEVEAAHLARIPPDLRPAFEVRLATARARIALVEDGNCRAAHDALAPLIESSPEDAVRVQGGLLLAELSLALSDAEGSRAELDRVRRRLSEWRERDGEAAVVREWPFFSAVHHHWTREHGTEEERRAAEDDLLRNFEAFLEEWSGTPLLPGGIGILGDSRRRDLGYEAIAITVARAGAEAGLEALVKTQLRGSLFRSLELPALDTESLKQSLCRPGEVVLSYFPATLGTHLFAMSEGSVEHRILPPQPDVDQAARTAEGRAALAESLFPPDLTANARSIGLVGLDLFDAWLLDLPLADGTPLHAGRAVHLLPSLPLADWLKRQEHEVSAQAAIVLALGDRTHPDGTEFSLDVESLFEPFPITTVLDLEREFRTHRALNDRATTEIRNANAFHVLAHGFRDQHGQRFVGLYAGRDENGENLVVWADELAEWPLPPLVVLAACHSGEGPRHVGEDGAHHLGGAALRAGAHCVLLGRGPLDADWTGRMLVALHQALARGETIAESLRNAYAQVGERGDSALYLLGDATRRLCAPPSLATDTTAPGPDPTGEAADGEAPTPTEPGSPGARLPTAWLTGAGALLAIAGVALILRSNRSRRSRKHQVR